MKGWLPPCGLPTSIKSIISKFYSATRDAHPTWKIEQLMMIEMMVVMMMLMKRINMEGCGFTGVSTEVVIIFVWKWVNAWLKHNNMELGCLRCICFLSVFQLSSDIFFNYFQKLKTAIISNNAWNYIMKITATSISLLYAWMLFSGLIIISSRCYIYVTVLHLHHSVTFTSRCYIYVTVFHLHHSVTFTSQCYIYITVLHLHRSVTFTSQCYIYITMLRLHHSVSFTHWNVIFLSGVPKQGSLKVKG